ncbi:hypothetical protein FQN57_004929 [Myotisia sp. PD_48]|nr:hypothetical protein FQN57_004929 [Myotisia sp. PD_48]
MIRAIIHGETSKPLEIYHEILKDWWRGTVVHVAGVVLAAIPLLIAALNTYKATKQRLINFRSKELFVAQLVQSLEEQKFFLETDLLITLMETTLDEEEVSTLLQEPNLNIFRDPEVSQAVQRYLGEGYEPYIQAIDRCYQILTKIAGRIGGFLSDPQAGLSALIEVHPLKNGRYELAKKIKFSSKKEELEGQIKELNDCTERLRRVRDSSTQRTEVILRSESRAITKYISALNAVRKYAHKLHSALSAGYIPGCHLEHETRLYLQSRAEIIEKGNHLSLKKASLAFTVAFPAAIEATAPSLPFYKAQVKVLEEEQDFIEPQIRDAEKSKFKVTFKLPTETKGPKPPPRDIQDLCKSLFEIQTKGKFFDLYLSAAGCLCYYHIPMDMVGQESSDILSLDRILEETSHPSLTLPKWTPIQRVSLSFNIASSLIQLHSTPWFRTPFTSKSIYFAPRIQFQNPVSGDSRTETPKPFIIHKFLNQSDTSLRCDCSTKQSILELGIVLLELWHSRTLESYAIEMKMPISDSYGSRYDIAQKWLNVSAHYILPSYLNAVTRCVECTFASGCPVLDWGDLTFRRSFCEYVLGPLLENCPAHFR